MDIMDVLKTLHGRQRLARSGMGTTCRLAAAWAAQGHTAVVVALSREEFNTAKSLCNLFLPELSLADPVAGQPRWDSPLLAFPAGVASFGQGSGWGERLASLYALLRGGGRCVVVALESLFCRLVPLRFFEDHELRLATGEEISPELLLEQAVSWGFVRGDMVTRPGDIARRGDILDIFPPGYGQPVRLEFFGDQLEDMRVFDPFSQRSLRTLSELTLLPRQAVDTQPCFCRKAEARWKRLETRGIVEEGIRAGWQRDLAGGGQHLLPGIFYDAPSVLEEWLPRDVLWFLPDEADLAEELLHTRTALEEALTTAPVPQPARLALREQGDLSRIWEHARCLQREVLHVGVDTEGIVLPERSLHSFSDLFPEPGAQDRPWQHLTAGLRQWPAKKRQIILSFSSERGRKKFLTLAEQDGFRPALRYDAARKGIFALISPFRDGVDMLWDGVLVLGEDILYPKAVRGNRVPSGAFRGMERYDDLNPGDLLVHRDYGIGRFCGLRRMELGGVANDFLELEYAGTDRLYVPADRLPLIRRFKGGDGAEPALDRLGSVSWAAGKDKARRAIEKIAADLVEMYAYRKVAKGFRYRPPDEIFREFEATFGFEETPDQARAIQDVLEDMDRPEPMDRLVCGDVGFGKTEVALRAAFRAAADGRQVAFLCPTTVLAEQHYRNFQTRLAGFPVTVGLLSRFVDARRRKLTLAEAAQGQIDILVGTHRLLSADVSLPNLGLLILDEEQRFGVRHKEKLKALKKNVDVLTLTATPIPRTLQLSMSGIRDLSIIETAPPERKPVATAILRREAPVLRDILQKELAREGQVFWVYNRVQGLERAAAYVRELAPEARVGIAHGQMPEKTLEETMRRFWHGELDVLVCTSIVESGLDFPRANTLIVDQAQLFGLGQLYQLRGRVGRSDQQAYAYFVVPEEDRLPELARERLRIILEMDYLGAGFQVAMEDLRLRGAGNLLGEVQSGHMARVGLDLYLEMLEEAVARLKGTAAPLETTEMNLGLPAFIPESYIGDSRERLRCYKALTAAADGAAREDLALGMRDRFGSPPQEVRNFLAVLELKQCLSRLQVQRADVYADRLRLIWAEDQHMVQPEPLIALVSARPGSRLLPPAGLELVLMGPEDVAERLLGARQLLESLAPA